MSDVNPALLAESTPRLVARLREEIAAAGSISFARFMEAALYDPADGYYVTPERRPGRGGDFLTAPEATPLFGISLARMALETWRRLGAPERFVIREYGAGVGGLAYDILAGLDDLDPAAFAAAEYRLVEVNEARVGEALTAMAQAGLADKVDAEVALAGAPLEPIAGLVLANEVADALPAHRLRWQDGRAHEVRTTWRDGWFTDVDAPLPAALATSVQALTDAGVVFADGDVFEVAPAAADWFADAARGLARGYLVTIDYGYPAHELWRGHRKQGGTVRGYAGHTVTDDPYRRVGRQDLTAHVDFTALQVAAEQTGATLAGFTSQGELLAALGLGDRLVQLQADPEMTLEQYLAAQAAVLRLIDPGGLGRFGVLAMARDMPPIAPWIVVGNNID
jgi:SAM-dependent MidA family methyltransferase